MIDIRDVAGIRRGAMITQPVFLDQLHLNSKFDPHWIPRTFGFMPYISLENHHKGSKDITSSFKKTNYF